eukprot:TRINITY_DN8648_c0_g1_i1.p1 TRINITY_DN8648_c0_g1~~TRINITY_DN8648_c0_g1_i1.p1  ORF type:complete len:472 (-),score=87.53 TRINITY_DN8648_c0_g1_i1:91-1506(-)
MNVSETLAGFLKRRPPKEYLESKNILESPLKAKGQRPKLARANSKSLEDYDRATVAASHKEANYVQQFGVELRDLKSRNNTIRKIPFVLNIAINYFISNEGWLDVEGIFRVPADLQELIKLRKNIEHGLVSLESVKNPHLVASIIKDFLRQLPSPVIPFDKFDEWIAILDLKEKKIPRALKHAIVSLPRINGKTLWFLCTFLQLLILHSSKNKMSQHNLSVVFAPTLIRKKVEKLDDMLRFDLQGRLIGTILNNYSTVFPAKFFSKMAPLEKRGSRVSFSSIESIKHIPLDGEFSEQEYIDLLSFTNEERLALWKLPHSPRSPLLFPRLKSKISYREENSKMRKNMQIQSHRKLGEARPLSVSAPRRRKKSADYVLLKKCTKEQPDTKRSLKKELKELKKQRDELKAENAALEKKKKEIQDKVKGLVRKKRETASSIESLVKAESALRASKKQLESDVAALIERAARNARG